MTQEAQKINIGLLFKLSIPQIQPYLNLLRKLDNEKQCEFFILHSGQKKQPPNLAPPPSTLDFIFCFGGDGTMLRSVKYGLLYDAPILGINLGVVGFLTDLDVQQFQKSFSLILSGKYKIENKMLLNVGFLNTHFSSEVNLLALNDVAIVKAEDTKTSHIKLSIKSGIVYETRCDGLVLSSPTGSTAYSLAAGGPIISPELDAIIATPLNPHTLNLRPIVFAPKEILRVSHDDYKPVQIFVDGVKVADIPQRHSVTVTRATDTVQFMKISHATYYQKLQKKMKMGMP